MSNVPPYLPTETSFEPQGFDPRVTRPLLKKASEDSELWEALLKYLPGMQGYSSLGLLLALFSAEAMVHKSHHWLTHGPNFYEHHLLYERAYDTTYAMIDPLAERAIGLGAGDVVAPATQARTILWFLNHMEPLGVKAMYLDLSKRAVLDTMLVLKNVYDKLRVQGNLTMGLDDMLQGFASKHEEMLYLFQQAASFR